MIKEITVSEVVAATTFTGVENALSDWRPIANTFRKMYRDARLQDDSLKLVLCLSDVLDQVGGRLRLSDFRSSTRVLVEHADEVVYRNKPDEDLVLKSRGGAI